jgi:hypothetical protein
MQLLGPCEELLPPPHSHNHTLVLLAPAPSQICADPTITDQRAPRTLCSKAVLSGALARPLACSFEPAPYAALPSWHVLRPAAQPTPVDVAACGACINDEP